MDHLKEGIGLRGYGQRDPLTEYKKEAFDMFQEMIDHLKEVVVEQLFKVRIGRRRTCSSERTVASAPALWQDSRVAARHRHQWPGPRRRRAASRPREQKVGRNDPCPCGSGKKYKKCCLLKGA